MDSKELQDSYGNLVDSLMESVKQNQRQLWKELPTSFTMVREFMETFGHPVYDTPRNIEDEAWLKMRLTLIQEEFVELLEACGFNADEVKFADFWKEGEADLVETADALGDLEYVTNGMALGSGINLPAIVREIHRSNMSKAGADGKPIWREDGKVLKGPNYFPPEIAKVLGIEE